MKITPRTDQPLPPLAKPNERKAAADPSRTPPPSVTAEISDEAQQKVLTSTGKNAASPAQRARETLDAYGNLGHRNFGKIVSALARGEDTAPADEPPATPPPKTDANTTGAGAADDGTTASPPEDTTTT